MGGTDRRCTGGACCGGAKRWAFDRAHGSAPSGPVAASVRISFLLPGYGRNPTGGYRAVYEYANHLAARGHQVVVVHARRMPEHEPPPPADLMNRVRILAVRLHQAFFTPRLKWQTIDERVRLLYVPEPTASLVPDADVVIAASWEAAESMWSYPASKGQKVYLVQDFHLGPKERRERGWRRPMTKVVVSRFIAKRLQAAGVDDVSYIPCGVAPDRFAVDRDPADRDEEIALMFSPSTCKASEDGIAALRLVKERRPNLLAVAFGVTPRPRSLPRWVPYHRRVGERRLREIYNSASVFLWSSMEEGFALPPAEAMRCGCAVATTDCGGNRDYAEHDVTALVSPPAQPKALAQNVLRLLEDRALRLRLARAGGERIQAFTWDRSADRLEALLLSRVRQSMAVS